MDKPVYEVMSSLAITATEDTPPSEIAAIMARNRFNRVPILNDTGWLSGSWLSGIVTREDILRAIAKSIGQ
ncbi:MAG: CBS domain-containing protein [Thermoplasmata archaeon]